MDTVLRAAFVYLFLLLVLQAAGRRTIGEMTVFDFLLLMLLGEAAQQALSGEDRSLTGAVIVISTLVGLDVILSLVKPSAPAVQRWLEGVPLVLVREGRPLVHLMRRARVDENEVLQAARMRGLENMGQIRYAVLETNGQISIIPREVPGPEGRITDS